MLLSWPLLTAYFLGLAALGVGIYMYSNWGKPESEPIKAGPAVTGRTPGEKAYGPFSVSPGVWVPAGIQITKGQQVRVEATGKWRYKEPPHTEVSPDGGGYWGWWVLKVKIGEELQNVGSKGSAVARDSGSLFLGAPATAKMGHAEEKALEGSFTVRVFVK